MAAFLIHRYSNCMNSKNREVLFSFLFFVSMLPVGFAYNPPVDDPKLEELAKNCKAITSEYKDALKGKKDFVLEEMKQTEDSLVAEGNKEKRVQLIEHFRDLKNQHDELSDKIRVINAGEVVKLSNTKDKVVAFLTHQ